MLLTHDVCSGVGGFSCGCVVAWDDTADRARRRIRSQLQELCRASQSLRTTQPHASLVVIALLLLCQAAFADESQYIGGDASTGSSRAVVVPDVAIITTGQIVPIAPSGDIADSPARQIEQALDNLARGLESADSNLENVVRLNVYVARPEKLPLVQAALARRFPGERRPSVTYAVTPFADSQVLISLDAVATTFSSPEKVRRSPPAAGPFAHTVSPAGGRIYVAGQAESGADLGEATRKTLASLRATLAWMGRSDDDILALKAFVAPAAEAETVHKEIVDFYNGQPAPPNSIVEWKSSASTPIEIELVAFGGPPDASKSIEFLTPPGMSASPVFSRVTRTYGGPTIFLSTLPARNATTPEEEARDVFAQLKSVLDEAGGDFKHLAKATYYVSSDEASQALNALRPEYYNPARPPAASKALVESLAWPNRGLALDMIAVPAR
jgi:enamine deaminase RidA (YjgF/YER057c/UK114 family)